MSVRSADILAKVERTSGPAMAEVSGSDSPRTSKVRSTPDSRVLASITPGGVAVVISIPIKAATIGEPSARAMTSLATRWLGGLDTKRITSVCGSFRKA